MESAGSHRPPTPPAPLTRTPGETALQRRGQTRQSERGPEREGAVDQAPPRCSEGHLVGKSPQGTGPRDPGRFGQTDTDVLVPGARRGARPHVFTCSANTECEALT